MKRPSRSARAERNARLVRLAAEVGVPEAARRLELGRSRAYELVGQATGTAAPLVAPGRAGGRASSAQLAVVLDELGADEINAAIQQTLYPAKTVGRLLDAVASWALDVQADPDADLDREDRKP